MAGSARRSSKGAVYIDPDYASELLERSVLTLPHTKVHGFGGDYGDVPEFVAGHLQIARENIAGTLARLVKRGWLEEEEALSLAADWLFNNPNRAFQRAGYKVETKIKQPPGRKAQHVYDVVVLREKWHLMGRPGGNK